MVIDNHRLNFGNPLLPPLGGQVLARDRDRWSDVVKGIVAPNPKVVENGSDSYLLKLDLAASHDRDTQI
jgi:hypothetical protein